MRVKIENFLGKWWSVLLWSTFPLGTVVQVKTDNQWR